MVAGLVVARFGQRGDGEHGDILDRAHLVRAAQYLALQKAVLVLQKLGAGLQLQVGLDAGPHHRRADRLGDVVDRAEGKALRLVLAFARGRSGR